MKTFAIAVLVSLVPAPSSAAESSAGMPKPIFSCGIGAKRVSITLVGTQLVYRYGTQQKEEMSIIGDRQSGNVFWLTQRMAGVEYQLRFKSGAYSYIVYNVEGNAMSGARPAAGLVVMQGTKTISDKSCAKYTEFEPNFDFSSLPEDSSEYSAM